MRMEQQVVIGAGFNGPTKSANGGYASGVLAEGIEGVATVDLRVPPPLDESMILEGNGTKSTLKHGDLLIGEAAAGELDLEIPKLPSLGQAAEATSQYRGFVNHLFPKCFVCGPERTEGDGLRIFPGAVDDSGLVAAVWIPHSAFAEGESVGLRHVWAALDCPSFFALPDTDYALLARFTADISRAPQVGEPLVASAWHLDSDGRKHHSASVLTTEDGEIIGRARALWIEPKSGPPV